MLYSSVMDKEDVRPHVIVLTQNNNQLKVDSVEIQKDAEGIFIIKVHVLVPEPIFVKGNFSTTLL